MVEHLEYPVGPRFPGAVAGLVLALVALPGGLTGQIAQLLGPHETVTLPLRGELRSTGRIGGLASDRYGYLYVANQDGGVWRIHPSGEVELLAEGFYGSSGNVVTRAGALLQADFNGNRIVRIDRDGTVHPFASEGFEGPVGITVTPGGDAFAVNYRSNYISKISPGGTVTEFVRDDRFDGPNGITTDPAGNLYVVNLGNTLVLKVTPEGEISEIARLPGISNAHVALADGALYVTQIWSHVVLRVEMDGSFQVVAGDGTLGFEDGPTGVATVAYPNGITAVGQSVYINTLRGNMIAGHMGTIEIRQLHLPSPRRAFVQAYEREGMDGLRAKFELARNLREVPIERVAPALYGAARRLIDLGNFEAGLALVEWTMDVDPDGFRGHMEMGNAHSRYGDKNVAIAHYEEAQALKPDDENTKLRLDGVRAYRR